MKHILQRLSRLTAAGLLLAGLSFGLGATALAADSIDDAKSAVCTGIGAVDGSGGNACEDPEDSASLSDTVANIINLVSLVVGVVAVIMVIVGGLRYVTSQGDSGATKSAKDTIIYAIIGLIVVALAQLIVRFTIGRVTSEAEAPAAQEQSGQQQQQVNCPPGYFPAGNRCVQ